MLIFFAAFSYRFFSSSVVCGSCEGDGGDDDSMLLTGCLCHDALHVIEEQIVGDRPYHGRFVVGSFEYHHLLCE